MGNMYTNGEYFEKNPTWDVEDSSWKATQIIKIINRNDLHPKSICEVGCGAGEILNQLHARLPNNILFEGYEISPQAFDLCKCRQKERLQYNLKDLLQDEKASFDMILTIDVIEHIDDYLGFLRNLRRKGEYKIFHIPLDISVQTVLRCSPIMGLRQNFGHIHYFTKETALATLLYAKYEILDYFYTDTVIESPRINTLKAFLARPLLKMMYKFNKDLTVRIFDGSSLMVLTK